MRYTLIPYQAQAVLGVLDNLATARDLYVSRKKLSQFSLSALTGAGKTVMAAAIIEALFFDDNECDFSADPTAVVLWFSDDPALNEQSRFRLLAASSKLGSRLRVIEPPLTETVFDPGCVYFLNTQKLSKNSRLVRAWHDSDDEDTLFKPPPDMLQTSFYDVLARTISHPDRTVYLILDEAHRGMKPQRDRLTIIQQLINGQEQVPPIPIVLGISATVDRFDQTMKGITSRVRLDTVSVDSAAVQASGLLKDDIVLSIPTTSGVFDTALLKRGVDKLKESTQAWKDYTQRDNLCEPVIPLLVVQMNDKPTDEDIAHVVDTILETWSDLSADCVAHVFGEHQDIHTGGYTIRYLEPQCVHDARWCRVLLAKTAISTGWDCPRAEVLVSFRTAVDRTYITQLLGRMVRTPLARRISGYDQLNSVYCVLPRFSPDTVKEVVDDLMAGVTRKDDSDAGGGQGRRVLLDPVDLYPRADLPSELWEKFESLPTMTIPQCPANPIKRFTALAAALAKDQIKDHAVNEAQNQLCDALEGAGVQYRAKVDEQRLVFESLGGQDIRHVFDTGYETHQSFQISADITTIDHSYKAATRVLTPQLCNEYIRRVASDGDSDEIVDAQIHLCALASVEEVVAHVKTHAQNLCRDWLNMTYVDRKNLPGDRRKEYEWITTTSAQPEIETLEKPQQAQVDSLDPANPKKRLPIDTTHIMVSDEGTYPVKLNKWEAQVLEIERSRTGFLGWYRNPNRGGRESLAVAYDDNGIYKALHPDFLFFFQVGDEITAVIVDPHGLFLADSMMKLHGLARFAHQCAEQEFRRIDAIAEHKITGKLMALDLTEPQIRSAVMESSTDDDPQTLYEKYGRIYY